MSKFDDIKAWGRASSDVSESRLAKIVSESKRIVPRPQRQSIDPHVIKFSQNSVKGDEVAKLSESMKTRGWPDTEPAIDVVKFPDGTLVTLDNKRVLAASRAGIDAKVRVRSANEGLSPEMAERFTTSKNGTPKNWEEAARFRINKQTRGYPDIYPNGSYVTGSNQ
tara:strand:- start:217 stop:714 length:498 start_codon:yes stop_codon:yes gene_type:complete